MSILFDDMKPRRIRELDLTRMTATVVDEGKEVGMELWADALGRLCLHYPEPVPIDQAGEREPTPVEQRWKGIDQV